MPLRYDPCPLFWIAMTLSTSSTSTLTMPRLGLGTWGMGESPALRSLEVATVRTAIGMGYRMIEAAEMYGDGGAEEVVGEALTQALRASEVQRDALFIVSKVYPNNAAALVRWQTPAPPCRRWSPKGALAAGV